MSKYEQNYGFDIISTNKIINCVNLTNSSEQELLFKYTIHQLKTYGKEDNVKEIEAVLHKIKIILTMRNIVKRRSILSVGKLILLISTQNYLAIVLSLVIISLSLAVVLLPAPFSCMNSFDFTAVKISQNVALNHICNTCLLLLGGDDRIKFYATNLVGGIFMILGKLFYFVFIASIVVKQFEKKIEL